MLTKQDIINKFQEQKDICFPLQLAKIEQPAAGYGVSYTPDALLTLALQDRTAVFLAEVKTRTAPKIIEEALCRIKHLNGTTNHNFILIVPYLSAKIAELLNREKISGIDLNGNYLIQAPGILAIRLDQKNNFPESQPIKNIFAGSSSLVGRLFLTTEGKFRTVNDVCARVHSLGGELSLSAVSKILKTLEEELIIEKSPAGIALLQPETLLQKLDENYRLPRITDSVKLNIPLNVHTDAELAKELGRVFTGTEWVITGESTALRYNVKTAAEVLKIYLKNNSLLLKYRTEGTFNILAQTTDDSYPYFDIKEENGARWASPVQCWLELSKLGKKPPENAVKGLCRPVAEKILQETV